MTVPYGSIVRMMYDTRYFEGLLLDTDNLSAVHFQLWRVGIKSY